MAYKYKKVNRLNDTENYISCVVILLKKLSLKLKNCYNYEIKLSFL